MTNGLQSGFQPAQTSFVDGSARASWIGIVPATPIRLTLPESLVYRALYFGLVVDNPAGKSWLVDIGIRLTSPTGAAFTLRGPRSNYGFQALTPSFSTGSTGNNGGSLPSYSVEWFDKASQQWAINNATPGGVQWVMYEDSNTRMAVVHGAPFYLAGNYTMAEVSVSGLAHSMIDNEALSLFLAVKSSNVPLE
jgi:hypothetical protein